MKSLYFKVYGVKVVGKTENYEPLGFGIKK